MCMVKEKGRLWVGKKSKEKRREQAEQATQHAILRLCKRAWGGRGTW